ncbi:hypothetical protein [Pseudomonas fluorescens]|uniref:Uncharacterized protein n=1 Tax=Pseudomonas fluorescens TaxID=294 RepID=A0A5E7S7E3_PSEFL|nr:hypothetical protein [Pseudomonas fluorescens]VVP79043.1 hypothetical protein PS928_00537 [Pseudomonas fluorescens]
MTEVKRYHVQLFKLAADQQKYAHGALGAVEIVRASDFDRVAAERDALQQRLNAADQRIDELTQSQAEPVTWGAPKTVRQLIRQLSTLDPDLETHAMLRIPDFKDGKQVRSCPLSISYERMEGPWLSSYKGEGRKVIAIWAKPDYRDLQDQGERLTKSAEFR